MGWSATARYDKKTGEMTIRAMQSTVHGDFGRVLWNSLDANARGVLKVHMKENAAATPVALPQVLRRAKCALFLAGHEH